MRRTTSILRKARGGPTAGRGGVAIITALALTALLASVAAGAQIGDWYVIHRQMQGAADAAALGGAQAYENSEDITTEAQSDAGQYGYVDGSGGVSVVVNSPPLSGRKAGVDGYVEVIITGTAPAGLAAMFISNPTVTARAVAGPTGGKNACILALDATAPNAVLLSSGMHLTNSSCGVASNSDSSTSLVLDSSAIIKGPVNVVGQWSLASGAALQGSPNLENAVQVSDPYAGVNAPSNKGSCTSQKGAVANNKTVSFTPGHFCTGWTFGNSATVTLASGVYYVDEQLTFGNSATISGTNVTIVTSGDYAINFGNNATITLTADKTGTYAGLAFYADRNGTSTTADYFGQNTILTVDGAFYAPNQELDLSGGVTIGTSACTQFIGDTVSLNGTANIGTNCSAVGGTNITMNAEIGLAE